MHKGITHTVAQIAGLKLLRQQGSTNGIPTGSLTEMIIRFDGGTHIRMLAWMPLFHKARHENIAKAFELLSKVTFQKRCSLYLDEWKRAGFFDYGKVRFYSDGTIQDLKKPAKRISLHRAWLEGRVSLGRSWGGDGVLMSGGSDDYVIDVSDEPLKPNFWTLLFKGISFSCCENRDVILAIMRSFSPK